MKLRKGQISFEYLLLSCVALVLVIFSVSSLFSIKSSFSNSADLLSFKESSNSISKSIQTICVLGDGNSQQIFLKQNLSISYLETEEKLVNIKSNYNNFSNTFASKCELSPKKKEIFGLITIKNENGIVILQNS
ncbi:MAG: class III signal peptide-containing protein [Candidatus Bilamarchaeum sp.]|jgi:uncharacterized protein (UPF0333 family)